MTETSTLTLTAFLLARIAEDEAQARDAGGIHWRMDAQGCCVMEAEGDTWMDNIETHDNGTAPHIASHDPARVLAECETKQRIVGWCTEVIGSRDLAMYGQHGALADDPDALAVTLAVETLRLLALPYSDHPDYRDEWRP